MNTTYDTSSGAGRRFGVLRQRDFRLLWAGESASGLGSSITTIALPLTAVVVLHAGSLAVGVLAAAVWLPWLVVGLPAGAWVDQLRRRPVMITCNLVSAAGYASVPLAAWFDVLTFAHLLVVALLCGASAVFFSTAYHAYLPAVLDERDLLEGNAKLQGSEAATLVLGRGAAGLIADVVGAVTGLLVDALTFVVSTVCLLRLRVREPAPAHPADGLTLRRQISEGLRFVARDPYLRPMVTYGAVLNLALMGYQAVQIVFLVRAVGVDSATVGALVMAGSLGGVLGAFLATAVGRRLGTARGTLLLQLCTGPFALLLPLTTPGAGLLFFAVGAFMVSAGVVACNVVLGGFRQRYCPPHLLGRVVATTMVLNHSTIPVGSVLGGWLGGLLGPRVALWVMAGLLAPCWLILALGPLRRRRDLPEAYEEEPAPGLAGARGAMTAQRSGAGCQ
ncbi:MFS transporter [Streptomyces sp. NPDC049555]|uniref:MFS transporter n=1 Tax=unclassified Streptomyces TaxID=2593676 RepID=UPI003436A52D